MGAGLSTSISVAVAVMMMLVYFVRLERYVVFEVQMLRRQAGPWKRILAVGLPPGAEFALIFVYIAIVYWTTRDFGPEAQTGFGVGSLALGIGANTAALVACCHPAWQPIQVDPMRMLRAE